MENGMARQKDKNEDPKQPGSAGAGDQNQPGAGDPNQPGAPGGQQNDPPPPPSQKGKKAYTCLHPVKHNGKRHDAEIELTPEEAEPLLAIGHIEPA